VVYEVPDYFDKNEHLLHQCGIKTAYRTGNTWYNLDHEPIWDSDLVYQYDILL
jgi:hypothetical protein